MEYARDSGQAQQAGRGKPFSPGNQPVPRIAAANQQRLDDAKGTNRINQQSQVGLRRQGSSVAVTILNKRGNASVEVVL